eukprot:Sdes_comp20161_c0_seq3m13314
MKIVALKTFERERKKLVEKKEKEFFFFFFKNSFYFYFKYWTKRFFFQTKTNQKEDKQEMEKPNPTTQILKKPMIYICGECGGENEIKPKDPIRCRECGYRIMYKKRTTRMVQFEAR